MTRFMRFWIRLGIVLGVPWVGTVGWFGMTEYRAEQERVSSVRANARFDFAVAETRWVAMVDRGLSAEEATAEIERSTPELRGPPAEWSQEDFVQRRIDARRPNSGSGAQVAGVAAALALLPIALYAGIGWAVNALFLREPQR